MTLKISMPDRLIHAFQSKVRAAFPKETLGYILGNVDEHGTACVNEIYEPSDLASRCTNNEVEVKYAWFREARARAKKIGAVVLGDIHSHPYTKLELAARRPDCSPSEKDLERYRPGFISGIVLVKETANGRLRLRTRYWGPMVPVMEVVSK